MFTSDNKLQHLSLPESSPPPKQSDQPDSDGPAQSSFDKERAVLALQVQQNVSRIATELEKLASNLEGSTMMTSEFEKIGELWKSLYDTMIIGEEGKPEPLEEAPIRIQQNS
ncbi:unnamed protein product [Kuraishia capsulata CBS 1993]|uniref:Uncharacterized protein n=1 Tax=Kuraishia capsulata CBS 1993 TaxID=1382522 RepID=W6MQ39_9ASCO|nr:uncharacterized protein KUCA_T00004834001 [Kuraishia capsulata CBS 1993]CDK28849.1 unnamed protein product [Kuraishia capsulata CBS 1993]